MTSGSADPAIKPRLVLHIGGAKCGSSAIQHALAVNAAQLLELGVLVPDPALETEAPSRGEQIGYFADLLKNPSAPALVAKKLEALAGHMAYKGLATLVVSAENLINERIYAQMLATARDWFDVTVVLYVRRQDDWLISAWQQWYLKQFESFDDFYAARASDYCNWGRLIVPWEATFGQANIKVRPFKRPLLVGGDAVEDFFAAAEIALPLTERDKQDRNRSFDETLGDFAHRNRDLFNGGGDNQFYEVFVSLLGARAFKSRRGSVLLSHARRLAIRERFSETNARLARRYFDEATAASLFEPPSPEESIEESDVEKLRHENTLLARAVFNLGQRVAELERAAKRAKGEA